MKDTFVNLLTQLIFGGLTRIVQRWTVGSLNLHYEKVHDVNFFTHTTQKDDYV